MSYTYISYKLACSWWLLWCRAPFGGNWSVLVIDHKNWLTSWLHLIIHFGVKCACCSVLHLTLWISLSSLTHWLPLGSVALRWNDLSLIWPVVSRTWSWMDKFLRWNFCYQVFLKVHSLALCCPLLYVPSRWCHERVWYLISCSWFICGVGHYSTRIRSFWLFGFIFES